jgi:hypothetical protein
MARQGRAIVGINADWFGSGTNGSIPRGGIVRNGRILKTPRPGFDANLYVGPGHRGHIGRLAFAGRVSNGSAITHRIYSVNTVSDALRGGAITLVTSELLRARLSGCTVVRGVWAPGKHIVTSVRHEKSFARLHRGRWALVGCHAGSAWLSKNIHVHDNLAITTRFVGARVRALVSGGRVLLKNGVPYNDVGGEVLGGDPRNPETFACVSKSGRRLQLGVVDGRSNVSAGVSYPQLTGYLRARGCYSALVFDGGGSTTLVARTAAQPYATVRNRPSDHTGPRHVADGMFVYAAVP